MYNIDILRFIHFVLRKRHDLSMGVTLRML